MRRLFSICVTGIVGFASVCAAQDLRAPASVSAGEEASIATTGSGKATFYLLGPGASNKGEVTLGQEIHLRVQDSRHAGNYLAILCTDICRSVAFYVVPAKPASLTFLVHPSRVPIGQGDAVSGVAIPFDQFHNLFLGAGEVTFKLASGNSDLTSKTVRIENGVAWFRTSSGKKAGTAQVTAALNELTARRAVQQVASDPCNLRIMGQRTAKGILVETETVRDCAGNPVPDGTIVTFTAAAANTKNTVDAPIKRGIARAQMDASGPVVVSVASGVVMGNELRIGAER
jgi:hypothetical protein